MSTVIPGRFQLLDGWRPAHMHFRIFQLDLYNKPIGEDFITQVYFNYDTAASLSPCTPKSLPAAGKIGKCVSVESMDEHCSKGELSASLDCSNDAWCCFDPKTVMKSLTKPKQSTVHSNTSCVPTAGDTLGPYYVNGAPVYTPTGHQTVMLCPNGFRDDRVLLSGYVRFRSDNVSCGVGKRALVDLWMSNQTGWYSIVPPSLQIPTPTAFQSAGPFTMATNATSANDPDWFCRLKIITGDDGYYSISTVIPGRYKLFAGWRPAHVHFRIFQLDQYNKPVGKDLITQVYIPANGCMLKV
ncbi:uncharacterized protein LOC129597284 isoform X2 [Paramacrobiotus metropolitanus]|uniref:uncharacterized protein LOC129597284 isoform X2 n=1 Tax=Paramacrobiotus metropolitanus TaxID=2943436 RepID=UPI002445DABD|nr:uncharacterized protein LOC129597284 isoform X2 [Paramacrobiotus metropolitanus]